MPWRPLIFDHGWLKLISFVLAALIWFAVHATVGVDPAAGRKMTREFLHRPVLLLAETAAHQAFQVEPAYVNVFVQGSVNLLNELKEQDIQVFVSLPEGRTSGTAPVRVHVPVGVTVSYIHPLTVSIRTADSP
jgi:YbbR domain-containing protein